MHRTLCLLFLLVAACHDAPRSLSVPPSDIVRLKPVADLKAADGEAFNGHPYSGVVLRDGGFAFMDMDEQQQVVRFDSLGRFRDVIGRKGQGPGEFQSVGPMFSFVGDTMAIFDPTLQTLKYFVHGRFSHQQRFDTWEFNHSLEKNLIGRFADGRWLALVSHPREIVSNDVRLIADTPTLVIGRGDEQPREFLKLRPRTRVDATIGNSSYVFVLTEVSPGIGAICDNGVVAVDTTGVHHFDVNGHPTGSYRIPVGRSAMNTARREGVVDGQLYGVPSGGAASQARKLLLGALSRADSALNQPNIDATGRAWFTTGYRTKEAYAQVRFDHDGTLDGAMQFEHSAPAVTGSSSAIGLIFDRAISESKLVLFPVPVPRSNGGPELGYCQTPFRY